MNDNAPRADVLTLTAKIVSAYVSKNSAGSGALPELIRAVFAALTGAGVPAAPPDERAPAVPVKRSVLPDYIICLEDGRRLKTLKRHLSAAFGLTPQQYRERWGLPPDYPMVAPNYAKRRSMLARQLGLGRKAAAPVPVVPVTRIKEGVSGRKKAKAA